MCEYVVTKAPRLSLHNFKSFHLLPSRSGASPASHSRFPVCRSQELEEEDEKGNGGCEREGGSREYPITVGLTILQVRILTVAPPTRTTALRDRIGSHQQVPLPCPPSDRVQLSMIELS